MKSAVWGGPGGEGDKELRLQYAMFMMARLRPRVGEKNKDVGYARSCRQCVQEQTCVGPQEVEVGEFGAVAFAARAIDAFTHQVDADTLPPGVRVCIGREKVAVAAADFPEERRVRGQDPVQFELKLRTPLCDNRPVFVPDIGEAGMH